MSPLLSICDLTVGFAPRGGQEPAGAVLRALALELDRGEVLALVGTSGAGKSLLAHAILGLLPPDAAVSGDIRFEGRSLDARTLPALRGRRIALVPQSVTHLDPLMPVGAQVRRAARRAGAADPGAAGFERFGLDPAWRDAHPHALSGGMARRVLALAALAGEPDLVIADEPTDHLDPASAAIVLRTLAGIAGRGGGVLLVTHDLVAVLPFATRVALVRDGRLEGLEPASAFTGAGEGIASAYGRALWRALPQNGFGADA
ncbi:ATP-binding cassette domain-containing protein [Aureimonas sp. AU22]|uniref:ATP-binding cassette domain-containing protein n=1 Tax=Aureimonas sp. AU22 TaxID=1638162 RepID=UPI000785F192|nr:ATP-binding cassette domain-containing protein [Aureimonas sp. AU22]